MQIMNTALPLGPYDWDPARDPQSLFEERLGRFRQIMQENQVYAVLLHGSTFDYGAIAWLTGFMPKLGPAFAFVPQVGGIRTVFTGGPGMRASVERLTWVEDVKSFKTVGEAYALWCSERSLLLRAALGIGNSAGISLGDWNDITKQVGEENLRDLSAPIDGLRRHKSAAERERISAAAGLVQQVAKVFRSAVQKGAGIRTAAIEAERAAYRLGVQDVRIMPSLTAGGMPLAFDNADDPVVENPQLYVAVRFHGYWAGAHFSAPHGQASLAKAQRAFVSALNNAAKSGASREIVLAAIDHAVRPVLPQDWRLGDLSGSGIGLSLEEAPWLETGGELLCDGDTLSLKAILEGPGTSRLPLSALVSMGSQGSKSLLSIQAHDSGRLQE